MKNTHLVLTALICSSVIAMDKSDYEIPRYPTCPSTPPSNQTNRSEHTKYCTSELPRSPKKSQYAKMVDDSLENVNTPLALRSKYFMWKNILDDSFSGKLYEFPVRKNDTKTIIQLAAFCGRAGLWWLREQIEEEKLDVTYDYPKKDVFSNNTKTDRICCTTTFDKDWGANSNNPLIIAVREGHVNIVQLLIEKCVEKIPTRFERDEKLIEQGRIAYQLMHACDHLVQELKRDKNINKETKEKLVRIGELVNPRLCLKE